MENNMNTSMKLALAGAALLIGLGSSAAQAQILNVVRDSNDSVVRAALSGDCVRHNQVVDADYCGGGCAKAMSDAAAAAAAEAAFLAASKTVSIYFDFNKSVLTPEARNTLTTFANNVKASGNKITGVRVGGFADRIGTAAVNERISKQRADTVRSFLLNQGVANVYNVETVWFGNSKPKTDCSKTLRGQALLKCLQPDRRVDVQIDTKVPAQK